MEDHEVVAHRINQAFLLIKQWPLPQKTLENLIAQGVPLDQRKYKWTAEDKETLKNAVHLLANNTEQPPCPPGKSHIKWLKEERFSGYGPSEDQIRQMLMNLRFV